MYSVETQELYYVILKKSSVPPFSLPEAKTMIFIYTQSHETIMFMEYQMQAYTVVLSLGLVIARGMHRFSVTIHSFRGDI